MPADPVALRRERLGEAAVFSLSGAAELLPLADADARRWLRDLGIVRHLGGRELVIWGDVVNAIRDGDAPRVQASRPRRQH